MLVDDTPSIQVLIRPDLPFAGAQFLTWKEESEDEAHAPEPTDATMSRKTLHFLTFAIQQVGILLRRCDIGNSFRRVGWPNVRISGPARLSEYDFLGVVGVLQEP